MNEGERDELFLKIFLTKIRDDGRELFGTSVKSVGFGNSLKNSYNEYRSIPNGFNLYSLLDMSDDDLTQFTKIMNIKKAVPRAKADVYINRIGYSIKSLRSSPPALVNHTSRPGFEFACKEKNIAIDELDKIIDEYWNLRLSGIINEDVRMTDDKCPFRFHKEYLKPILEYFLFIGTGSSISKYPAAYLIEFVDPFDVSTYKRLTPFDAVEECWDKLIFSLRSKGMPNNFYPNKNTKCQSIAKWVKCIDGKNKGSLHIRQK